MEEKCQVTNAQMFYLVFFYGALIKFYRVYMEKVSNHVYYYYLEQFLRSKSRNHVQAYQVNLYLFYDGGTSKHNVFLMVECMLNVQWRSMNKIGGMCGLVG